ncbi:MAG: transcriptional regulator [Candidatus Tyloplasma litorale]|nr:MAG: transcriptional regulator [Mycoplasmatales bacterium]
MNKQEIIDEIAKSYDLTKIQAKAIFEQIFDDIVNAVMSNKTDNKIQIPGFGIFEMKKRKAREARNPRTGEKVKVPAKKVFKFKPSETLKNKIN